jgi:hypothetical protein
VLVAVPVLATLLWPVNSWIERQYTKKFGAERTTWSVDTDEGRDSFEGAIRSTDGSWNHGYFVVSDGSLRWIPRSSDQPRWETEIAATDIHGVRSPRPGEWWAVNPNCVIVDVSGSAGGAELVLSRSDLEHLRRVLLDARFSRDA